MSERKEGFYGFVGKYRENRGSERFSPVREALIRAEAGMRRLEHLSIAITLGTSALVGGILGNEYLFTSVVNTSNPFPDILNFGAATIAGVALGTFVGWETWKLLRACNQPRRLFGS
ncbi:MAG: hypothetical protein M1142_00715 [Patescibacteria group bacterium]|nr:hypothetical protein [Patescibacteria group bacterium]